MNEDLSDVSYKDALARIDQIIEQIDGNDQDIDALAPLVEEAAALLAHCRQRLDRTRLRVDSSLEDILRVASSEDGDSDS